MAVDTYLLETMGNIVFNSALSYFATMKLIDDNIRTPTPPDGIVAHKQGSRSVPSRTFPHVYKDCCLLNASTAYTVPGLYPLAVVDGATSYGMDRSPRLPRA